MSAGQPVRTSGDKAICSPLSVETPEMPRISPYLPFPGERNRLPQRGPEVSHFCTSRFAFIDAVANHTRRNRADLTVWSINALL